MKLALGTLSAVITTAIFSAPACAALSRSANRPNIVLIMADDLGFSDLGCYGGEIRTPHLDRLADAGMRFTQFYNCGVCAPTRAALMTGLYARRSSALSEKMVTIAEVLRRAGYSTSISGKWNCQRQDPDSPLDWGFEEFYGVPDFPSNYFDPALRDLKSGGFRKFQHNRMPVKEFPAEYYVTDAINDHAIEMIERFSERDNPFFVYVGHCAPHSPLQAKPKDIERYQGEYSDGWDVLRERRYQRQCEMGLIDPEWHLPDSDVDALCWTQQANKDWQESRMEVYAAMVDCMDQGIGRILKSLRDCDVDRNTIVFFLSDNGGSHQEMRWDQPGISPGGIGTYSFCGPGWAFLQNTPFRSFKMYTHEGGIATPMVVSWPGRIEAGSITDQVGHVIDIMPTLAELARASYPKSLNGMASTPCEGKSLVPILHGETRDGHKFLYWYVPHTGAGAVRRGQWKLVSKGVNTPWELYNIVPDRTETQNLIDQLPDRAARMAEAWFTWARRMGYADKLPQAAVE